MMRRTRRRIEALELELAETRRDRDTLIVHCVSAGDLPPGDWRVSRSMTIELGGRTVHVNAGDAIRGKDA